MSTPRPGIGPSPYARFRRDHTRVLARLAGLEAAAPKDGRRLRERLLAQHLRSLGKQFDTHMAAEEALLYPFLARAFPEAAGSLEPLQEEHVDLREMLAGLRASLERPRGRERDVQISVQVRDFVDLLRAHIRKEESVVFDVSERVLRSRDLEGLARRLASFLPARNRRPSRRQKGNRTS